MVERLQPPRPAPELIGPDGHKRDVAGLSDRALAVNNADGLMRVEHKVDMLTRGLRLELDDFGDRIKSLEHGRAMRPPMTSSSDWNVMFAEAGAELSKRVRDPRDNMDSNRARAIAQEVYNAARNEEDAQSLRSMRGSGKNVRDQILAAVVAGVVLAIASVVAGHFAWR